jgi:hypothetical protein
MTRLRTLTRRLLPLAVGLFSFAAPAGAQTWVDWTAVAPGAPTGGSAAGSLPLGTGPVGVTFSGEVQGASSISTGSSAGTPFDPAMWPSTFTSATAPVGPTNNGWIQLIGPSQNNILTFDSPVNRVFFAIISLGQAGRTVDYAFDLPFTILSQGPGNWGGCSTCLSQIFPTVIHGEEGNGVLMFESATGISSLAFDVLDNEDYHGFTIGVDAVTATPEPASLALLATGLVGVFGVARRRRKPTGV